MCRVPTQRGIYLFSVSVDIIQVRRTCTAASSRPHRHVCCRGCPSCCCLPADAYFTSHAIGVHVPVCLQLLMVAGAAGRLRKAILEDVILAGTSVLLHK